MYSYTLRAFREFFVQAWRKAERLQRFNYYTE